MFIISTPPPNCNLQLVHIECHVLISLKNISKCCLRAAADVIGALNVNISRHMSPKAADLVLEHNWAQLFKASLA